MEGYCFFVNDNDDQTVNFCQISALYYRGDNKNRRNLRNEPKHLPIYSPLLQRNKKVSGATLYFCVF